MENPATWNRATHVISDAIGEHSLQILAGVFGHSCARIVHDALEREGLLASEVKPEKDRECICEGEFPEHCGPECDCFHHNAGTDHKGDAVWPYGGQR